MSEEEDLLYMGSLEPYFDLIQNEYARERERKQSLETRSGIIITVATGMFSYLFNSIKIKIIFQLFADVLTFFSLLKIVSGMLIYVSFFACILFSFKTINTSVHSYFDISIITPEILGHQKNFEMIDIITAYKEVVLNHRNNNEEKAKFLRLSIRSIVVCAISTCVYINLLGA